MVLPQNSHEKGTLLSTSWHCCHSNSYSRVWRESNRNGRWLGWMSRETQWPLHTHGSSLQYNLLFLPKPRQHRGVASHRKFWFSTKDSSDFKTTPDNCYPAGVKLLVTCVKQRRSSNLWYQRAMILSKNGLELVVSPVVSTNERYVAWWHSKYIKYPSHYGAVWNQTRKHVSKRQVMATKEEIICLLEPLAVGKAVMGVIVIRFESWYQ
jgi:hypothetical protein